MQVHFKCSGHVIEALKAILGQMRHGAGCNRRGEGALLDLGQSSQSRRVHLHSSRTCCVTGSTFPQIGPRHQPQVRHPHHVSRERVVAPTMENDKRPQKQQRVHSRGWCRLPDRPKKTHFTAFMQFPQYGTDGIPSHGKLILRVSTEQRVQG